MTMWRRRKSGRRRKWRQRKWRQLQRDERWRCSNGTATSGSNNVKPGVVGGRRRSNRIWRSNSNGNRGGERQSSMTSGDDYEDVGGVGE